MVALLGLHLLSSHFLKAVQLCTPVLWIRVLDCRGVEKDPELSWSYLRRCIEAVQHLGCLIQEHQL